MEIAHLRRARRIGVCQALKIASEYASERKQFGQLIGQFQAISHPLADCLCYVDGGKLLTWAAIRAIAERHQRRRRAHSHGGLLERTRGR